MEQITKDKIRSLLLKSLSSKKGEFARSLNEVYDFIDEHIESQVKKFSIQSDVNGTFCTCDPRPKDVFVYMSGDETLFAFCEKCKKQVQNLH